jgi:chemotaxis protein CheZ
MNGVLSGRNLIWRESSIDAKRVGESMAVARKVFRIEQSVAARLETAATVQDGVRNGDIERAIAALRALMAAATSGSPAAAAAGGSKLARLSAELERIAGAAYESDKIGSGRPRALTSRIGHELSAVVDGSEQATQKILSAAEQIDAAANALAVALAGKSERRLAQDIQHLVVRIFEACNFQDLIGQRVAKVVAALQCVEVQMARVLEEITTASGARALHGPRLEGDCGHASQEDINAMFAGNNAD